MRRLMLILLLGATSALGVEPKVISIRALGARQFSDKDLEPFKNTIIIARAIDEATRAPGYDKVGAIVSIPAGRWLTGPIELKGNITLRLEEGAALVFSSDVEDDPEAVLTRWEGIECWNYGGYIRARDASNIAISGKGSIDANGRSWWPQARTQESARRKLRDMGHGGGDPQQRRFNAPPRWEDVFGAHGREEGLLRPSFIQFINCSNIRLEGVTVRNAPMWAIHPIYCRDVVCRDLKVVALGPDGDGIVADSCSRVKIENCIFDCAEDCVAVKSGRDADGRRVDKPSEDVTIRKCTFIRGASGVAIGSETSGSIRRVIVTECYMKGVTRGLRIKTMRGRGGEIRDIQFTASRLLEIGEAGVSIDMQLNPTRPQDYSREQIPMIDTVLIRGIECGGGRQPWRIRGLPEQPVIGLRIADVKLRADRGIDLQHANTTEMLDPEVWAKDGPALAASSVQDCRVERLKILKPPEKGPVVSLRDARSFTLSSVHAPDETDLFLRVAGARSQDITLENCDTRSAQEAIRFEDQAPQDVVNVVE